MASPSRTPSRGRSAAGARGSSSRRADSSGGNQQTMVLGGIAVLVVIVLIVMMKGGDKPADKKDSSAPPTSAPAPKATPVVTNTAAKAGKTPDRPAPQVTAEMMTKARQQLAEMKAFYNEGSTARTAGDNAKAREKQAQAKTVLDTIEKELEAPLRWQEEADLGNWAQPAEYVDLVNFYNEVMSLAKMVRMGGGK